MTVCHSERNGMYADWPNEEDDYKSFRSVDARSFIDGKASGAAIRRLRSWRSTDVVYVVQAAHGGNVKIGTSGHLESRLRNMRSSSPVYLELRLVFAGGREAESFLHRKFAGFRLHGEWFSPDRELLGWTAARITDIGDHNNGYGDDH